MDRKISKTATRTEGRDVSSPPTRKDNTPDCSCKPLRVKACLSTYLSILLYLLVYPPRPTYLSVLPPIYLSLSRYLSVYLPMYLALSICLSTSVYLCLYVAGTRQSGGGSRTRVLFRAHWAGLFAMARQRGATPRESFSRAEGAGLVQTRGTCGTATPRALDTSLLLRPRPSRPSCKTVERARGAL